MKLDQMNFPRNFFLIISDLDDKYVGFFKKWVLGRVPSTEPFEKLISSFQ